MTIVGKCVEIECVLILILAEFYGESNIKSVQHAEHKQSPN